MLSTTAQFPVVPAGDDWQVVDFISDLHLQSGEPATARVWAQYMQATPADALFILGDLFEVWVGDDGPQGDDTEARFEHHCLEVLSATARRCAVFLMHGNRDFLFSPALAQAHGLQWLDDPTVLAFAGQRWLLSHGDALCLEDQAYLQFRAQVRAAPWQGNFLARPLNERRALARQLRQQSEARKRSGQPYADVDAAAAQAWLQQGAAHALIHGHTHRPADHLLGAGQLRHVLSDWDALAQPPRTQVLRLERSAQGVALTRLDAQQAGLPLV